MTISGIGPNASLYQGALQSLSGQQRADMQHLGQALQGGSLGSAQQSFAAFLQTFSGAQGGQAPVQATTGTAATASPIGALAQALQSGNLSAAQQAYAALSGQQNHAVQPASAASAGQSAKGGSDGDGDGSSIHVTA